MGVGEQVLPTMKIGRTITTTMIMGRFILETMATMAQDTHRYAFDEIPKPAPYQRRRVVWCASALSTSAAAALPSQGASYPILPWFVVSPLRRDPTLRADTRSTQPSRTLIKMGTETVSDDSARLGCVHMVLPATFRSVMRLQVRER